MRKVISDTLAIKLEIEEIKKKLSENGKNIGLVFDYLDEFQRDKNLEPRKRIGYKP